MLFSFISYFVSPFAHRGCGSVALICLGWRLICLGCAFCLCKVFFTSDIGGGSCPFYLNLFPHLYLLSSLPSSFIITLSFFVFLTSDFLLLPFCLILLFIFLHFSCLLFILLSSFFFCRLTNFLVYVCFFLTFLHSPSSFWFHGSSFYLFNNSSFFFFSLTFFLLITFFHYFTFLPVYLFLFSFFFLLL